MFRKLCLLFASCILFANISAKSVPESGLEVPQTTPCSLAFCAYNTTCKDVPATDCAKPPCGLTAKCVPISESETTTTTGQQTCADMTCGDDQYCSMNQVQCFRAPCPAMPMCITIPTPSITCANVRCAGGPCVMERKQDPKTNVWSLHPVCQPRPTA